MAVTPETVDLTPEERERLEFARGWLRYAEGSTCTSIARGLIATLDAHFPLSSDPAKEEA